MHVHPMHMHMHITCTCARVQIAALKSQLDQEKFEKNSIAKELEYVSKEKQGSANDDFVRALDVQ